MLMCFFLFVCNWPVWRKRGNLAPFFAIRGLNTVNLRLLCGHENEKINLKIKNVHLWKMKTMS